VAARDRGFGPKQRKSIDLTVARAYREAMRRFCDLPALELWYIQIDRSVEQVVEQWAARLGHEQLARCERDIAKARAKDSLRAFAKLTHLVDGRPRIICSPPLIVPIEDLAGADDPERLDEAVQALVDDYRGTLPGDRRQLLEHYHYVHAARKVVGVGSVATRAWIMLMLGRDDGDPRCSCRSRRRRPPYSSRFSAKASSPITASASSKASA
jgi:hypothetical protein